VGYRLCHASRRNPDNGLQQWKPPSPDTIPQGPLGDGIRLGRLIFTKTPKYAPAYVGDYTDKASIFHTTPKKNHLGRDEPLPPTQIRRALREHGIGWIAAHFPQA
jgi:hypothetical protein